MKHFCCGCRGTFSREEMSLSPVYCKKCAEEYARSEEKDYDPDLDLEREVNPELRELPF